MSQDKGRFFSVKNSTAACLNWLGEAVDKQYDTKPGIIKKTLGSLGHSPGSGKMPQR